MSLYNCVSIPEQFFLDGKIKVNQLTLFSLKDKCFLFDENNGVGILLEDDIAKTLLNGDPSEELLFKLVQRTMAIEVNSLRKTRSIVPDIKPSFFLIDMTKRCNLACAYCIRNEYKESVNQDSITLEQLIDVCRFIANHVRSEKINSFTIQPWGGEPTLEIDKLISIRQFFRSEGLYPNIRFVCNGTLLDKRTVQLFKQYGLEYSISIDGTKEIHDSQRIYECGRGSYDDTINGIACAQEFYDSKVSTLTTLTANSLSEAANILEHFAVDLKIPFCKLNFVNLTDDDILSVNNCDLNNAIKKIIDKLIDLNNIGHPILESNIRQRVFNLLHRSNESICLSAGCQGGRRMVSFDFVGNVFPCELIGIDKFKLGNIHEGKSLREMLGEALLANPYFEDRREPKCIKCHWRYYCRGGCTSAAHVQNKSDKKIDVTTCALNRIIYPALIEKILDDPQQINVLAGRRLFL